MSFKNMSFGKLLGIFAGFLVVILLGAVVAIKLSASKSTPAAVTKTYAPAAPQAAPSQAASTQQTPGQTDAPVPQAALRMLDTASSGGAPVATEPAFGTQVTYDKPAQPDMSQQLAAIDRQLTSIQTRLAALESKPASGSAVSRKTATQAAPARRPQVSRAPAPLKSGAAETPSYRAKASEVSAMAVVGNRAWVQGPNGLEESVTKGDLMPVHRPRVRSVDAATGVVILSSDID